MAYTLNVNNKKHRLIRSSHIQIGLLFVVQVCGITITRSKELSEYFRNKIIDVQESENKSKMITKQLDSYYFTVQKNMYKWRTF